MKLSSHHQQQLPPIIRARPAHPDDREAGQPLFSFRPDYQEEDREAGQPLVPARPDQTEEDREAAHLLVPARPDQLEGDREAGQPLVPALQIVEEGEGLSSVLRLELEPEMPALRDLAHRDRTVDPSA
jgi:hypothetical protein